jgi:hypothetical protein
MMNRVARLASLCAVFIATAALGDRLVPPPAIEFPDFPFNVAVVDLGQTLTVKVDTAKLGDKGVTWTCKGDACTKLTSTSQWATFYASGITGTATITATSIAHPSLHESLKVTVYLNAVPNMLCDTVPTRTATGPVSS